MKRLFILSLILFFVYCQEINSIQAKVISSTTYYTIEQNQNYIFAVALRSIDQYDFNNDLTYQNHSLVQQISSYNSFKINDQYMMLGITATPPLLMIIPLNNLQSSATSTTLGSVSCVELYQNNQIFVGTSVGVEKWDIFTFTRLQSVSDVYIYDLKHINSSLFVLGSAKIEERSVNDLTILYNTSSTTSSYGASNVLMIGYNNLFIGYYKGMIQQLNWNTKLFVQNYNNHTQPITSLVISNEYLFSGSWDYYWIQWRISNGQIIRKVNTGNEIFKLLINDPFLITVGYSGLRKYLIPELGNFTEPVSSSSAIKSTSTIQTSFLSKVQTTSDLLVQTTSNVVESVAVQTTPAVTNEIGLTFTQSSSNKPTQTLSNSPIALTIQSQEFPFYFWPAVIVLGLLFFVLINCVAYRLYLNRLKVKTTTKKDLNSTTTTTATESEFEETTTQTTTASTLTFTETQMVTQNAYSIPGYLQMKNKDFRIMKEIAKGGQGTVSIAEVLNSQFISQYKIKQVIVKSTGLNFDQLSERQQNCFNQELAIIHYFKDKPGFVRLFGYIMEPACLILKYYPLGSMENLVRKKGPFTNLITTKRFIIFFLWELAQTLFLLHDAGFIHCDIKPQNILLEGDQRGALHPILTDFGITQVISSKVLQVKAMNVENLRGFSVNYAAPQQILRAREKYVPSTTDILKRQDIYPIAGLLYAMIMGKEPFII